MYGLVLVTLNLLSLQPWSHQPPPCCLASRSSVAASWSRARASLSSLSACSALSLASRSMRPSSARRFLAAVRQLAVKIMIMHHSLTMQCPLTDLTLVAIELGRHLGHPRLLPLSLILDVSSLSPIDKKLVTENTNLK